LFKHGKRGVAQSFTQYWMSLFIMINFVIKSQKNIFTPKSLRYHVPHRGFSQRLDAPKFLT
jgi:hypothetical protein